MKLVIAEKPSVQEVNRYWKWTWRYCESVEV